jgi:hypothetical protein
VHRKPKIWSKPSTETPQTPIFKVEAPEPRGLDPREFDISDVIDIEQAPAMDESHNLIMTGIMAGQFLQSILKYGERASLNEVHARQDNPAFQKRPPLAKVSPLQLRPNIPLGSPAGLSLSAD